MLQVLLSLLLTAATIAAAATEMPEDVYLAYLTDGWDQPPYEGAVALVTHTSESPESLSETGHYVTECKIHFTWVSYTGEVPLDWEGESKILLGADFVARYEAEEVLFGHPSGCRTMFLTN